MAVVRVGDSKKDPITWDGGEGKPLYFDRVRDTLWTWLPLQAKGDRLGLDLGDGTPVKDLGAFDPATRSLFDIRIDKDPQTFVKASSPGELPPIPPFSLTEVDASVAAAIRDVSLSEYVGREEPSVSVLRRLAWLASQHYEDFKRLGYDKWLATLKWDDLLSASRPIERDNNLFVNLMWSVEARHLVFLLGGYESGLTTFLDQFKGFLARQQPGKSHLTADFNSERFDNALELLQALLQGLPIDPYTTALYIDLAYSAYESIVESESKSVEKLEGVAGAGARDYPNVFVVRYVDQLNIGGGKGRKCPVESFLAFLSDMMKASGREGTLTVLLSFPGLFKWMKKHRGEQVADMVRRQLWTELKAFANMNYDTSTGALKHDSPLSRIEPRVGVVVELQRLPLTDIARGFCHYSVLTLPPFSESEVQRMWDQRIGLPIGAEDVQSLVNKTGGHPWFLDLLLRCVALQFSERTTTDRAKVHVGLASASVMAEGLLKAPGAANGQAEELRGRVDMYIKDLERILTTPTRTDSGQLDLLDRGSHKAVQVLPSPIIEEWLESGLVWPRAPSIKPNSLLGFSAYPTGLETYQRGTLASLVVKRLMAAKD